jgi:membrane fusion protein, heavy metal efflux system
LAPLHRGAFSLRFANHPRDRMARRAILTGEGDAALAVPRDAIIYDGDVPHAWAVRDDSKAIEMRRVKVGQTSAKMVEILEGLVASDRVITRGSLFIDRVAAAGR